MRFQMIGAATLMAALLAAGAVLAQPAPDGGAPPPSAERQARGAKIRAACQADMAKLCPGLEPGRPTFQCIRQHHDDLSDGCKAALDAARAGWSGHGGGGPPGPGVPPTEGAPPPPPDAPPPPPAAPN